MPIPFLVGAALAGLATAAGVGVKKTIDAHQDNKDRRQRQMCIRDRIVMMQ